MCMSGHPEQRVHLGPGFRERVSGQPQRFARSTINGPARERSGVRFYRCVQQLLLYHSGCQEVKRAATTYRHNIGAYWTRATFFPALRIWPRYVIIRRAASPRYLWDREWEIEIESCPGSPICRSSPICLPKRTAYLRNRYRLSLPWGGSLGCSNGIAWCINTPGARRIQTFSYINL